MLEFLISGLDSSGQKRVERITAESSEQAYAQFSARGHSDVVLHEDELISMNRWLAVREAERERLVAPPPPPPEVAHRNRFPPPPPTGQKIIERLTRPTSGALLLSAIFLVALLAGAPWWAIAAMGVLAIVPFGYGAMLRPGVLYGDLLDALLARQGPRALSLVDRLEKSLRVLKIYAAAGTAEIATRRAQALILSERPDEARRELERLRTELDAPEWFYLTKKAAIHATALEREDDVRALAEALKTAPPMRTMFLDYAMKLALILDDAVRARQAMEEADKLPPTELSLILRPVFDGAVLIVEQNYLEAKARLSQAAPELSHVSMNPFEVLRKSLLCVALARLGETEEARRLLGEVQPRLLEMRELELLERCTDALSGK